MLGNSPAKWKESIKYHKKPSSLQCISSLCRLGRLFCLLRCWINVSSIGRTASRFKIITNIMCPQLFGGDFSDSWRILLGAPLWLLLGFLVAKMHFLLKTPGPLALQIAANQNLLAQGNEKGRKDKNFPVLAASCFLKACKAWVMKEERGFRRDWRMRGPDISREPWGSCRNTGKCVEDQCCSYKTPNKRDYCLNAFLCIIKQLLRSQGSCFKWISHHHNYGRNTECSEIQIQETPFWWREGNHHPPGLWSLGTWGWSLSRKGQCSGT